MDACQLIVVHTGKYSIAFSSTNDKYALVKVLFWQNYLEYPYSDTENLFSVIENNVYNESVKVLQKVKLRT